MVEIGRGKLPRDLYEEARQRLTAIRDGPTHRATSDDINYALELRESRDRRISDLAYEALKAIGHY